MAAIFGALASLVVALLFDRFVPAGRSCKMNSRACAENARRTLVHLLAAQAGAIQQDGEAIDLGQTPGDIVFASSADSELSLLAGAADRASYDGLRLANLLRLSHNLSVDLWLDQTVCRAKLVVVRLLGGPAYWQYGVDEFIALAAEWRWIRLAAPPWRRHSRPHPPATAPPFPPMIGIACSHC